MTNDEIGTPATAGDEVEIRLNGEVRRVPAGRSLPQLLTDLGLGPQGALVEHNGRALLRSEWAGVRVREGDQLEILRVVAGG